MNHPQIVPRAGRLVTVEDEGILARDLERSLTGAGFDVRAWPPIPKRPSRWWPPNTLTSC